MGEQVSGGVWEGGCRRGCGRVSARASKGVSMHASVIRAMSGVVRG